MVARLIALLGACALLSACAARGSSASGPLTIGETFTIASAIMGEERRVNVFVPTVYGEKIDAPMPVLYMLDGGVGEDFLHIAGLVQILVSNGGMRPFMLVGVENTQRRRDMTGPTEREEDRAIAPLVGGSATFRRFIAEELMPAVRSGYRTSGETAIIGESLAGLFAVETLVREPDLFTTYIAIDPSLWWNSGALVQDAGSRRSAPPAVGTTLFVACSNEPTTLTLCTRLADALGANPDSGVVVHLVPLPAESHATVYHPAALLALRSVLGQPAGP